MFLHQRSLARVKRHLTEHEKVFANCMLHCPENVISLWSFLPTFLDHFRGNFFKLNSAAFHCPIFVCVHVHESTHICVHICLHMCVCGRQRLTFGVFLSCSLPHFLRQGFLVNLGLDGIVRLASQWETEVLLLPETGAVIFYLICGHWRFRGPQTHTRDPSSQIQPSLISIIIIAMPFSSISEYLLLYPLQLSFSLVRSVSLIQHTFLFPVHYIKVCSVPPKLIVPYK